MSAKRILTQALMAVQQAGSDPLSHLFSLPSIPGEDGSAVIERFSSHISQPYLRSHQTEHPAESVHPPAFPLASSFPVPPLWLGFGTHENEPHIYTNLSSDPAYLDRHLGDGGY